LDLVTAITAITARILETYALFARNQTAVYKSIPKRNKTRRRLVLKPEICTGSTLKLRNPGTLTNTLLVHTYNMWLKSRVKIVQVVKIN
jgi:hypothetical protein